VLPAAGDLFGRATDLMVNDCDEVQAPTWVNGNAVLLGDAAHAMLPNVGQGANSALVDSVVLAEELDRNDLEAGLAAYAARRQPAVRRVQRDAALLARFAHMTNGASRLLRNTALWVGGLVPSGSRTRRLMQEDPARLLANTEASASPPHST
jgi:2-polyprenyl-6-methoxyphenol hydroxylase-like FAD-dependent oxidoreductase